MLQLLYRGSDFSRSNWKFSVSVSQIGERKNLDIDFESINIPIYNSVVHFFLIAIEFNSWQFSAQ